MKKIIKIYAKIDNILTKNVYLIVWTAIITAPVLFVGVYSYFYFQKILMTGIIRLAASFMLMILIIPATFLLMMGVAEPKIRQTLKFFKYVFGLFMLIGNLLLVLFNNINYITFMLLVDAGSISFWWVKGTYGFLQKAKRWVKSTDITTSDKLSFIKGGMMTILTIVGSILSSLLVLKQLFE